MFHRCCLLTQLGLISDKERCVRLTAVNWLILSCYIYQLSYRHSLFYILSGCLLLCWHFTPSRILSWLVWLWRIMLVSAKLHLCLSNHYLLAISQSSRGSVVRCRYKTLQYQNICHTLTSHDVLFPAEHRFWALHLFLIICLSTFLSISLYLVSLFYLSLSPVFTHLTLAVIILFSIPFIAPLFSLHPSILPAVWQGVCVVFIRVTSGLFPGHVLATASSAWWLPWVLPLHEPPCSLCKLQPVQRTRRHSWTYTHTHPHTHVQNLWHTHWIMQYTQYGCMQATADSHIVCIDMHQHTLTHK